jgi:hypothetical protein
MKKTQNTITWTIQDNGQKPPQLVIQDTLGTLAHDVPRFQPRSGEMKADYRATRKALLKSTPLDWKAALDHIQDLAMEAAMEVHEAELDCPGAPVSQWDREERKALHTSQALEAVLDQMHLVYC